MSGGRYLEEKERRNSHFLWWLSLIGGVLLVVSLGVALFLNTGAGARAPVRFTAKDTELVSLKSRCGCEADVERLLLEPLRWDLTGNRPKVLIVHTHACESYTPSDGEQYDETERFRTLDEKYNMVAIGDRVADILERNGVEVIHDTTLYDYPSYDDAYDNARQAVEEQLKNDPEISLVLDLHRDAVENEDGTQWGPTVELDGERVANLMMVMGTGCGGSPQPHWEDNLAVAVKLQAVLERRYPGLCRETELLSFQYNQDLSDGFLLVEIGTAGNTRQEALAAAEKLAEGILALAGGANT